MMRGSHMITAWSKTQQLVSQSSAEAGLNASIKAGQEGICLRNMLAECGRRLEVHIYGDSSASQGIASRSGVGKVKHLSIRQLWVQERVEDGDLVVHKIPRCENVSDALTHHWHTAEGSKHFETMNCIRWSVFAAVEAASAKGGSGETRAQG